MSMLIYTAANERYWHFAPLYIYFALSSNTQWAIEVGLEHADRFKDEFSGALKILNSQFRGRFKITDLDFQDKIPNVVRFLNAPSFETDRDYIYIGDIDILILEDDIEDQHRAHMKKNKLPFSNKIRLRKNKGDKPRLTGLHFAPMKLQYPLPDFSDLEINGFNAGGVDEQILYKIMERKGVMIPESVTFRPDHGIHISHNRHPFGKRDDGKNLKFDFEEIRQKKQSVAWSNIHKPKFREKLANRLADPVYQALFFELDIKARNIMMILENIVADRFDEFYKESLKYVTQIQPK